MASFLSPSLASVLLLTLACGSTPAPDGSSSGGAGSGGGGAAAGGASATGGFAGTVAAGGNGGALAAGSGGQAAAGSAGSGGGALQGTVQIYWIDVEGGAATLLVAPNGQTLLADAGWSGDRDAQRIEQALHDAGAAKLDYMITTHYHGDHVGGVPDLAKRVTIDHFYDHGATVEPGGLFDAYVATAGQKRTIAKAGDTLKLADLELTFVTAAGKVIDPALPTAIANEYCASSMDVTATAGEENPMSLGFVAKFGDFEFVDLGDLTLMIELDLMCPTNRIGVVDLYQVNHHGQNISSSPQLVHSFAPTVAVMDNGASKGGAATTFDVLNVSPGLQALWSLHWVDGNDAAHNAEEALIANLSDGPDTANWIRALVESDGSYTLTNGRTGMSRTYQTR